MLTPGSAPESSANPSVASDSRPLDHPDEHDTTRISTADYIEIKRGSTPIHTVPSVNCPDCHRTLMPVEVRFCKHPVHQEVPPGLHPVWLMKCPTERTMFEYEALS